MARRRNDNEHKARILSKAQEYFSRFGYSKTNIEDIIKDLGMSRKTLYECFKGGKEEILKAVVSAEKIEIEQKVNQIIQNENQNFYEKYKQILAFIFKSIFKSETLIGDLNKNYPALLAEINNFNKKNIINNIVKLFKQGQKEGRIRKNIPLNFLLEYHAQSFENRSFHDLLEEHSISLAQAHEMLSNILFKGIEAGEKD